MSKRKRQLKKMMLMLCLDALIAPASAQHFKQVVGFTGSMQQVAAGRNEVFGINSSGQVFRFVASKFVAIPGTLSQIAAGGRKINHQRKGGYASERVGYEEAHGYLDVIHASDSLCAERFHRDLAL